MKWLTLGANVLAALTWGLSAILPRYPRKFTSPFSAPSPELIPLVRALKLQSVLSAVAAILTAIGAVAAAFS